MGDGTRAATCASNSGLKAMPKPICGGTLLADQRWYSLALGDRGAGAHDVSRYVRLSVADAEAILCVVARPEDGPP